MKIETIAIHGGYEPEETTKSVAVPIYQTASYAFDDTQHGADLFDLKVKGNIYTRIMNPTTEVLENRVAAMEGGVGGLAFSSGMAAISAAILNITGNGDNIVSTSSLYGGTVSLFKDTFPKMGIETRFGDVKNLKELENKIDSRTKLIFCESIGNPAANVTDIGEISKLAHKHNIPLFIDNTDPSPYVCRQIEHGADIVIHSLTKFINGASDTVGGIICSTKEFVGDLIDVNEGAAMLFGPTMDAIRANGILKNLRTLPIRIKQHSRNALLLANKFKELGLKVHYPGLESHPQHELMKKSMNAEFGFGGMLVLDVGSMKNAYQVMEEMQNNNIGYLAVSLGFYKTLFSAPGASTSSEIPQEEQDEMGISEGMIRMSIGLDNDIERTFQKMKKCLIKTNILK